MRLAPCLVHSNARHRTRSGDWASALHRRPGASYRELDDDDRDHCIGYGEATGRTASGGACGRGRKIDYVFVARDRIVLTAGYSADARSRVRGCATADGGLCSDHRMLTGRVRVRIAR